jgi:hypothetical protein
MANNKELQSGLRAMTEDFQLPGGGRKKLARLVAVHLWWFEAAGARGMSWQDMIRALTAAGGRQATQCRHPVFDGVA